jgi:hypothetical protein
MGPLTELDGPVIYLNGPIQGVANWQQDAIDVLQDLAPDVHVASPRMGQFNGAQEAHWIWEASYSERAARDGVILYWLARETRHRCSRSFAAQTRFELGEWAVKSSAGMARLVVGIERGFTGGPYLQRRFTLAYSNVPICRTLRQTCAAAVEMVQKQTPLVVYPRNLAELFVPPHLGPKLNE